jgi:hypothetical protein
MSLIRGYVEERVFIESSPPLPLISALLHLLNINENIFSVS